jgi:glutamyl-tRNA reductase
MHLLAVGLNHTTAPVSLREKVAFPADQIGQAVASARAWFGGHDKIVASGEAAILSTCNRTELYAAAAAGQDGVEFAIDRTAQFLAEYHHIPYADLRPTCIRCRRTMPCATPSASPPGWTRWCWASRRSWAR